MKRTRPQWRRIALLVSLIVSLWLIGWATGVHELATVDQIRASVDRAGGWGIFLFIAIFTVGQVAHISGHPFIAASVFAWGWWQGALASIVAATIGAMISFALARGIAGDVRGAESRVIQRVLVRLDDTPLRTIVLARAILMTAPPLAPAFAVSGVSHRDHGLATLIGLLPSVAVSAYAWSIGLEWLGVG